MHKAELAVCDVAITFILNSSQATQLSNKKVCLQERKLGHICITELHTGFRELFRSNFSLSLVKSANELKIIKSQSLDTLNLHLFLCLWHAAVSIEVITESFHGQKDFIVLPWKADD